MPTERVLCQSSRYVNSFCQYNRKMFYSEIDRYPLKNSSAHKKPPKALHFRTKLDPFKVSQVLPCTFVSTFFTYMKGPTPWTYPKSKKRATPGDMEGADIIRPPCVDSVRRVASWPRTKAGRQWQGGKERAGGGGPGAAKHGVEEKRARRGRVSRENVSWPRSRVTTLRTVGSGSLRREEGPPRISVLHYYSMCRSGGGYATRHTATAEESGRVRVPGRACTRSRTTEPSSSAPRSLFPGEHIARGARVRALTRRGSSHASPQRSMSTRCHASA